MILKKLAQCSKYLEFKNFQSWPEVLAVPCWQGHRLTHFKSDQAMAVDYETHEATLETLLFATYPHLSFAELAELYGAWSAQPEIHPHWESIFQFYGYRFSNQLCQTISHLYQAPETFIFWAHDKGLKARDLSILLSFDEVAPLNTVMEKISALQVSKSEGVKILEWAGELLLSGHSLKEVLPGEDKTDSWLRSLQSKRYPSSYQQDNSKQQTVKTFAWPKHTQAQWLRQGDRTGIELKLHVQSPEDFAKKLQALHRVQQDLHECSEKLWQF